MTREELIITTLERENAELRDRVAYLESCLFEQGARYDLLGLTTTEARIFGALLKRSMLTKEQTMAILYEDRIDQDTPDPKIVDVLVCKIRAKTKVYGITIKTIWGQGYAIPPEVKGLVRSLLAGFGDERARVA